MKHRKLALLLSVVLGGSMMVGCASSSSDDLIVVGPDPTDPVAPVDPGPLTFGNQGLNDLNWGDDIDVTAFFPGHVNWQWLSGVVDYPHAAGETADAAPSHAGGPLVTTLPCAGCHDSAALQGFGDKLVDLERDDYAKPGYKSATVNAAYDSDFFYLRVQYESDTQSPSITHQMFRYDGESGFQSAGVPRDFEADRIGDGDLSPGQLFNYEDRVAVMLNPVMDGALVGHETGANFNLQGCFLACHNGMRNTPDRVARDGDNFDGLPFATENDVRHYLLVTRDTDGANATVGHWNEMATGYDRTTYREDGVFLDLWQARAARSAPMGQASNDYVIDYRLSGAGGANNWFDNRPQDYADDGQPGADGWPRWIYDPRVTGFWAIDERQIDELQAAGVGPLRTEETTNPMSGQTFPQNGVEFEELFARVNGVWVLSADVQVADGDTATAGTPASEIFQAGDLVPRRALRQATGARAGVETFWEWDGGTSTVVFKRHLEAQHSSDKTIDLNNGHTIALALFDDNVSNRSHYVSLPFTIDFRNAGLN